MFLTPLFTCRKTEDHLLILTAFKQQGKRKLLDLKLLVPKKIILWLQSFTQILKGSTISITIGLRFCSHYMLEDTDTDCPKSRY